MYIAKQKQTHRLKIPNKLVASSGEREVVVAHYGYGIKRYNVQNGELYPLSYNNF